MASASAFLGDGCDRVRERSLSFGDFEESVVFFVYDRSKLSVYNTCTLMKILGDHDTHMLER